MSEFQMWVLGILEKIPEFNIAFPDFMYKFAKNLVQLMNCFVVFNDFVPLLYASVMLSAVHLTIALLDYVRSYKK